MPYVTVGKENGANIDIYYKDWGKGQPIVFSHGWPLSADDWDPQMLFFLSKGYRVIAHDRRGHGRSTQTGGGHDMNHYADDLKAVTDHLNLNDAIHVGHSTGGGQVTRRFTGMAPPLRSNVTTRLTPTATFPSISQKRMFCTLATRGGTDI